MDGFDDPGIFFSDNFGGDDGQSDITINLQSVKKKFKDFLRQFHEGNFNYKYRDLLKRQYNLGQYWIQISIEDIASFDETLADKLYKQPAEHLPLFEEAAKDVADEVTAPRPDGEEKVEDIQVLLSSESFSSNLRDLKSDTVSHLVKIPGIVVSATGVRAKATRIAIQCRSCKTIIPDLPVKPGLDGYNLPRKCNTIQTQRIWQKDLEKDKRAAEKRKAQFLLKELECKKRQVQEKMTEELSKIDSEIKQLSS